MTLQRQSTLPPTAILTQILDLTVTLTSSTWPSNSNQFMAASCSLFSYENLVSTAREFARKCETLRCENSTPAIISLNYGMSTHNLSAPTTDLQYINQWLLLINGIDVTILWAGLAKRSKEISACDFYDARRTFYASSYENLAEKVRDTLHVCQQPKLEITSTGF